LHIATKRNRYHIISLLLKFGSRIDERDYYGRTSLHIAAFYGNVESLKVLLYNFASPLKVNNEGKLPIELAVNSNIRFFLERAKNVNTI
jgi:Arf-GAP/coiled-coil/ANK repeat/PH domain-containing protein